MFSVTVKPCSWSKTELGLFSTGTIPAMTAICLPYMGKIYSDVPKETLKSNKYLFKVHNVGIIDPTTLDGDKIDHDLITKSRNLSVYINEPQQNQMANCFFTQVGFYMVAVSWHEIKAGQEITALYEHDQEEIPENEKYLRDYIPGTDPVDIKVSNHVFLPEGMSYPEFEMYTKVGFSMYA